jgi:hypothetical protein
MPKTCRGEILGFKNRSEELVFTFGYVPSSMED